MPYRIQRNLALCVRGLTARMGSMVLAFQARRGNVRIDLSRGQAGMAEHLLDAAQVSPTFQKVGRKCMAHVVRAQGGFQARK